MAAKQSAGQGSDDAASVATTRVSLTSRGRTFIAVGVISVLTGLALGVQDLQRLGVLLLVLPLPAWWAVRQARSGLRVGHSVSSARVVRGERAEVRVVLSNPQPFGTGPLRVTETVPRGRPLRFSVAGVRGRQHRTVAYPLPALPRGRYAVGPTTVVASDPFGLITAESRSTDTAELIVRPETVPLPALPLPMAWRDGAATMSHSVGAGGSDDASVREYRHGDDLRKIHWRSTARSGGLMVRQEERPWHGESLVLLDTRVGAYPVGGGIYPGGGGSAGALDAESAAFEWAVTAAASIGRHLAERGRRVAVVTGGGQVAHDDAAAILDLAAEVRPALRADVQPLVTALTGLGRESSVFAILAATPKSSVGELLVKPQLPGSAVALLLRPWTWAAGGRDALSETAWRSTADSLRASGWRVLPVEAGDELVELWPTLLTTRPAVLR